MFAVDCDGVFAFPGRLKQDKYIAPGLDILDKCKTTKVFI